MDKARLIDLQVKKIHMDIKKSSLVLRERMHDIQAELTEWYTGNNDEERNSNGWF